MKIVIDILWSGRLETVDTASDIIKEWVQKLGSLWSELFEMDVVHLYMTKFPEHLQSFCQEVYDESIQRKKTLASNIHGKWRDFSFNFIKILIGKCKFWLKYIKKLKGL